MYSLQDIKIRLGAVKNVGKITKAMEVVAATKMRRSQEIAMRGRPYFFEALLMLQKLTHDQPFFSKLEERRRLPQKTLIVLLASDKGLTSAFNAQVFRACDRFLSSLDGEYEIVAVGKKAELYAKKKGIDIVQNFYGAGDYVSYEECAPIADLIIERFLSGFCGRVVVISTHFRTALKQDVILREILPLDVEKIKETAEEIIPEYGRFSLATKPLFRLGGSAAKLTDYIFEPSREEVLNLLFPYLLKVQLYHLILEANASEHSARRVAMKTASDNAEELSHELLLQYNNARQAAITREIIEINSAKNALV